MLFELGLLSTVGISSWLALDLLLAERWRRRSSGIGWLGVAAGLWAASELLIGRAQGPEQLAFGRRALYLGATALPVCWLWVAAMAAQPRWWRRAPGLIAVAAVPAALSYSLLYWGENGWLIDLTSPTPRHGPLFPLHVALGWTQMAVGLVYFLRAATTLGAVSPLRAATLLVGVLLPLGGNVLYILGALGFDPTPAMIGFSALGIRLAIIEGGLSLFLPLAHQDVVEQLEVGILVADARGRVVHANRTARSWIGRPHTSGRDLDELLHAVHADATRSVEVQRVALRSRLSEVGSAVVLTDRTEAERIGRRLELASRLEAVGTFTAGIAHEVNNPLAYIRSNLVQLEKLWREAGDAGAVDDRFADGLEMIEESREGFERIAWLVQRLKAFTKDDGGHSLTRIDPAVPARKAMAMASIGLAPDAIAWAHEPTPAVVADGTAVVQIVLNLLLNAIQASDPPTAIGVCVGPGGGGATIRVTDRGAGIDPRVRPQIFDPFFTTKAAGSGLGLSLSFDLARQMGGRLEAANRPGGGACFTLWLPPDPSEPDADA